MPNHYLRVHKLPQAVDEKELIGSTVIVIDLLRATSTICQALAAGAREVVPFLEIDDALAAASGVDLADILRGVDRLAVKMPAWFLAGVDAVSAAAAVVAQNR